MRLRWALGFALAPVLALASGCAAEADGDEGAVSGASGAVARDVPGNGYEHRCLVNAGAMFRSAGEGETIGSSITRIGNLSCNTYVGLVTDGEATGFLRRPAVLKKVPGQGDKLVPFVEVGLFPNHEAACGGSCYRRSDFARSARSTPSGLVLEPGPASTPPITGWVALDNLSCYDEGFEDPGDWINSTSCGASLDYFSVNQVSKADVEAKLAGVSYVTSAIAGFSQVRSKELKTGASTTGFAFIGEVSSAGNYWCGVRKGNESKIIARAQLTAAGSELYCMVENTPGASMLVGKE